MIREKDKITLTDADENRFTIYDVEEAETESLVKNLQGTFVKIAVVLTVILIGLCVCLILLPLAWGFRVLLGVLIAITAFVELINANLFRTNVRSFRARNHYILVQVTEKLPVEKEVWKNAQKKDETHLFYPVRARDTKKRNYTSICYLTKEEYDTVQIGDEKKLFVPLSRRSSRKK